MEEDERQKVLNELFNRLQQFDYENKQLIDERARLNEKVENLNRNLTKVTAELNSIKNSNEELIKNVRAAIKKELSSAPKKAKR
jgi:hypothetical protein